MRDPFGFDNSYGDDGGGFNLGDWYMGGMGGFSGFVDTYLMGGSRPRGHGWLRRLVLPGGHTNPHARQGRDLTGSDLRDADLRGIDVVGAWLNGVDLTGADFSGADARGAHFEGSCLRSVSFEGADLRYAHLQDADLQDADLRGSRFNGYTQWPELFDAEAAGALRIPDVPCVEIKHRNTGAVLHAVDSDVLIGADMRGLDLRGAQLSGQRLRGANLENANLEGASFVMADLGSANLRGARLANAMLCGNLRGADLRGADLTGADLDRANYDDSTRWPEGFDPAAHGARYNPL
jgi:uncharacterized protein YjbI with pentapeptide repeats